MDKLTKRSKIQVRWSTDPADMGYGNGPSPKQLPGKPDYIGSPRTAREYAYKIRQNVGMETYIRIEYRHRARVLRDGELQDLLYS
jgi:hypothetical protein